MTVPAQVAKLQSPIACVEQDPGVELDAEDVPPNHRAQLSVEKTSAALLVLYDQPAAAWAATALWDENRDIIERACSSVCIPSTPASASVFSPGSLRKPGFFARKWTNPKPGLPAAPTSSPGASLSL